MGERFYNQQIQATGGLYNNTTTKRRKSMWTDELREQAVKEYTEAKPTPENSMEIIHEIASGMGATDNGVRMILTKAGVYVKKKSAKASSSGDKPKTTRVSKEAAQSALSTYIEEELGQEVNMDIISKLTGKAAVYFTELLTKIKDAE